MTFRAALLLSLSLPLSACGSPSEVDEKNASVEEISDKVREVSRDRGFIRPGQWASTIRIEQMDMPGMPPEATEQMKKMMTQAQTSQTCVTPEEVNNPKPDLFGGNEKCRYDHFTMGNGKIDAQMRCTQDGGTQVMQMAGTYSDNTYTMHMQSRSEGGGQPMSMKMTVEAKRVGECSGKEG